MSGCNCETIRVQQMSPGATLPLWLDAGSMITANGVVTDQIVQVNATIEPSGARELYIGGGPGGQSLYMIGSAIVVWITGGVPGRGAYLMYLTITMASGTVYSVPVVIPISAIGAVTPVPEPPSTGPSAPVIWTP
jgi:hypothetical protein